MISLTGRGSPSAYAQKIEEHMLISKMYERSPNFKQLAKDICHKPAKSKVGLTDQYPLMVHAATNFQKHIKKLEKLEKR